MPWKMDGENIALNDGKPVWIDKDGQEAPFDAEHALSKISSLNSESAARKRELREAQDKLKSFEGIDDPAAALKAMKTMTNLDDKKLIDAGEVEKVKAEVTKAMQAKIDEAAKRADEAESTLHKEMIGGRFSRSKFIAEKLAVPVDMVEATFGRHFAIEEGQVIAKGHDGQKIFSREKPGDIASFDEALSILVDGYSNKDSILKGSDASGGGASPGGGSNGSANVRTISRADFEKLDPTARMSFFKDGTGQVVD